MHIHVCLLASWYYAPSNIASLYPFYDTGAIKLRDRMDPYEKRRLGNHAMRLTSSLLHFPLVYFTP